MQRDIYFVPFIVHNIQYLKQSKWLSHTGSEHMEIKESVHSIIEYKSNL